ncbi:IS4 family transposase [Aquaspirillum sp. LM1]
MEERRKGDSEPGAKTLWLGLRDIAVCVEGCALLVSCCVRCV